MSRGRGRVDFSPPMAPTPQPPSGGIFGDYLAAIANGADPSGGILGGHPAVSAYGADIPLGGEMFNQYANGSPPPSLSQNALNLFATPFDGGASAHLAPFSSNLPVASPQASWVAPQLPLFPAENKGDGFSAAPPADDSPVLSDANPDAWLPNAQYANRGVRRGGRRAGEPELAPPEEIRWTIYNHNWEVLRQLEPQNRLLFSIHDGRWVPSESQIRTLREEIERARARTRSDLEPHHNLPRQFVNQFNGCGLDIEDYVTYLPRAAHRLLPNGLHTGLESWNRVWRQYFAQQPRTSSTNEETEEILKQLIRMWEKAQWLRR